MTSAEAKRVLLSMGVGVKPYCVTCGTEGYLYGEADSPQIAIDGRYTADQLCAIAQWMRDPKGVSEA